MPDSTATSFVRDGYVKVPNLLQPDEVARLLRLYERFLDGSSTFHGGVTLHYSRGNTTDGHRRALILNFRPAEMIRLERELGFDHGKSGNVRVNRNAGTN